MCRISRQERWRGRSSFKPASLFMASLCASCLVSAADSLRFTSIQMPALVQRGTNFWLACQFELAAAPAGHATDDSATDEPEPEPAGEQLYSVKWYKNNEEFYRLIFASGGANQPATQAEQAAAQQQYFAQPGVNVLMSSSNATHVRLLNASLESDGSYACEISTQNLSTIRYEKEIKVYVLPGAKLNLIGLRGLYALGERVELNCLSDFSRPAGALGWFINDRRVITAGPFLVEPPLTKAKPSEPRLTRSSLALKFKLTSELLAASSSSSSSLQTWNLLAGNNSYARATQTPTTSSKRNQSKLFPLKQGEEEEQARPLAASGARLVELLRLECRYKLTEVSDVTFSELRVANGRAVSTSGVDGARPAAVAVGGDARSASGFKRRRVPQSRRRRSVLVAAEERRARAAGPQPLRLAKSPANQVLQSSCPAGRDELLALLAAPTKRDACRAGLLALHREDPVIVAPEGARDVADDGTAGRDDWLELAVGAALGVNCSTLGASAGGRPRDERQWRGSSNEEERFKDFEADQSVIYCGDIEARKRLLISGRQTGEQHWPAAGQRHKGAAQPATSRRHNVAFVALEVTTAPRSNASDNERRLGRAKSHEQDDDKSSLSSAAAAAAAADSSNSLQLNALKSLGQLHKSAGPDSDAASNFNMQQSAWSAPPLLEWFINNQEAPKSSASYSPELPLTPSVPSQQAAPQADRRRNTLKPEEEPSQLPSIDYREYFANFAARPLDQHLMLRLDLDKKHFVTSDSMLKLRCTSTQAQVLAIDSLDVSLYAVPAGFDLQDQPGRQDQTGEHRLGSSSWHKQPSNQIKSKYLYRSEGDAERRRHRLRPVSKPSVASSASVSLPSSRPLFQLLVALTSFACLGLF